MSTNRDAGEALQKTVFDALTAALTGTDVLDHVPEKTNKPYVTIGDIETDEWGCKNSEDGTEHVVTVECFADGARGRKQVRLMQRAIYDALHHQPLTVADSNLVLIRFDSSSAGRLSDGLTYQGISRFRALVESTE